MALSQEHRSVLIIRNGKKTLYRKKKRRPSRAPSTTSTRHDIVITKDTDKKRPVWLIRSRFRIITVIYFWRHQCLKRITECYGKDRPNWPVRISPLAPLDKCVNKCTKKANFFWEKIKSNLWLAGRIFPPQSSSSIDELGDAMDPKAKVNRFVSPWEIWDFPSKIAKKKQNKTMDNGQDTPREKGLSEDDLHDESPGFFIRFAFLSFRSSSFFFCSALVLRFLAIPITNRLQKGNPIPREKSYWNRMFVFLGGIFSGTVDHVLGAVQRNDPRPGHGPRLFPRRRRTPHQSNSLAFFSCWLFFLFFGNTVTLRKFFGFSCLTVLSSAKEWNLNQKEMFKRPSFNEARNSSGVFVGGIPRRRESRNRVGRNRKKRIRRGINLLIAPLPVPWGVVKAMESGFTCYFLYFVCFFEGLFLFFTRRSSHEHFAVALMTTITSDRITRSLVGSHYEHSMGSFWNRPFHIIPSLIESHYERDRFFGIRPDFDECPPAR